MRPRAIVQVTLFDRETGVVEKSIIQEVSGGGAYHWEVRQQFERLGATVADMVDPDGKLE